MKFDVSLAGFVLSLVLAGSGWYFRWNDKRKFEKHEDNLERHEAIRQAAVEAEKKVNSERDFNHLLSNQKQISAGIASGFDDIEDKLEHLRELTLEIKAYMIQHHKTIRTD